jgi:hypothetical protein
MVQHYFDFGIGVIKILCREISLSQLRSTLRYDESVVSLGKGEYNYGWN